MSPHSHAETQPILEVKGQVEARSNTSAPGGRFPTNRTDFRVPENERREFRRIIGNGNGFQLQRREIAAKVQVQLAPIRKEALSPRPPKTIPFVAILSVQRVVFFVQACTFSRPSSRLRRIPVGAAISGDGMDRK